MSGSKGTETPFGSNAMRLSGKQWAAAAVIVVGLSLLIPRAWERAEAFEPDAAYRIPYALSNDYWHFARYCRSAADTEATLVLGDSVVWGEYVTPRETLAQHLEEFRGSPFANLGVNGIHPVALAGLVAHYGRAISGRNVLLHYNPLWMSSMRHDLQTEKEFRFNHPKLVPQFTVKIPCYKDPYAERLGIVAERYLPLRSWTSHVALAYFDNTSVPAWALQHPCENPLGSVGFELPALDQSERHGDPVPWTERGMSAQEFEWVPADASLQWRLFLKTVNTLQRRGNNLFVLVGPFNEHMIAPKSAAAYEAIKSAIADTLDEKRIPHFVAPVLPSELYADASHPISEGYALLAKRMMADGGFAEFMSCEL